MFHDGCPGHGSGYCCRERYHPSAWFCMHCGDVLEPGSWPARRWELLKLVTPLAVCHTCHLKFQRFAGTMIFPQGSWCIAKQWNRTKRWQISDIRTIGIGRVCWVSWCQGQRDGWLECQFLSTWQSVNASFYMLLVHLFVLFIYLSIHRSIVYLRVCPAIRSFCLALSVCLSTGHGSTCQSFSLAVTTRSYTTSSKPWKHSENILWDFIQIW